MEDKLTMEDRLIVEELIETIDTLERIAKVQVGKQRKEALAVAVRHLQSLKGAIELSRHV